MYKAIDSLRMNKSAFSIRSLSDPSDDKEYWLAKTPAERLEAVELMRQVLYGYDSATARIQKVFKIVPLAAFHKTSQLENS